MILGRGDIASVLPDNEELVFFACGVSNSRCEDKTEYKREIETLSKLPVTKRIVYFSSLSIFDKNTRYTRHKLNMESKVKEWFPMYCIIRLGNITWGNNPNTFLNFIRAKMEAGEAYTVFDEVKYMVEKDEFLHWIAKIPNFNCEMNIPGTTMTVQQAINKYILNK